MSDVVISGGYWQNLADGTYLPTICRGYGIDYTIPIVGTSGSISFPNQRQWDYYKEGTQTAITWKNYYENCNELSTKPSYPFWTDFTSAHAKILSGYNSSDDIEAYKAIFNSHVSWLWGSLDDGGACLIKRSVNTTTPENSTYWFLLVYGLFERESENVDFRLGQYYYFTQLAGGGISLNVTQLQHIGFHLENNNDVVLAMYCAGASWYSGGVYGVLGSGPAEACTNTTEWKIALGIPDWVSTPVLAWYYEGGGSSLNLLFYSETIENAIWISGSPYSEDEFGSEPSGSGGVNTSGGGYGTPATDTGDVDGESADDLNLLTAINSGLATLYNPTQAELSAFASFLYTGITDSISNQLKKLVANPLDFMLFVALAKFNPPTSGSQEIGFAGVGSGVSAQKISNQFMELDCGSIDYAEQFKSFLDYSGKTTCQIYLPFCGIHDLNINDVVGSRINVNYIIDLLSGSCIARVKCTRSIRNTAPQDSRLNDVIYEFQGNVYLTMPISSTDWRGTYQALVGLAGGVVTGIATGGVGGLASIGASVTNAVTSEKVSVGRSGQAGSAYGYLNNKKPYLILERPIQNLPTNWGGFEGYRSNQRVQVGKLKGYTEIDQNTIWSDNFAHATDEETQMIKDIMNGGVYL